MKIVIGYPPLDPSKGIPLLGQNRQFQWAHTPWTAYPVVPAYAATMLRQAGYQVCWLDGINQSWDYQRWQKNLTKENPDFLLIESKTPVIKHHWKIINQLKKTNPKLKIVLAGDHVTALPEESFQHCLVDYVLTGGDYDFLLLNLVNHLRHKENLEPGIYYREKIKNQKSKIKNTGKFQLNHDLNKLPLLDRELSQWRIYAFKNSNYSLLPGTYTMFGRDCWWGRCSFCSWTTLYPGKAYRVVSPEKALDEIGAIINKYPIKEIMDDSGTFPTGDWLREFCQGMIKRAYQTKVKISVNMRFNTGLKKKDYLLMAKAGFRFLLYGLESASQKTLDQINKNLKVEQIKSVLSWAKEAGLYPHLTVMIGYPWETKKEVQKTLTFCSQVFKKGLADSLQATLVIPYPGTPLFQQAQAKGWLKTLDWNKYDMRSSVLKTPIPDEELKSLIRQFYRTVFTPSFFVRKTFQALANIDLFKYYLRLALKFPSKQLDFLK